ncbi:alpha-L-rhamnosidase [Paenibacillus sp. Y412MC10]|uniref:alpha-L-rhamnosidase n=1 Tax=Geobacillus sp. (strain Y412MC10) TaxID=481743 RepID=UPI0011A52E4D|nr:alpha-L-rhamnosidase [Paenibacillus sp. Y412MC10]
MSTLGITKLTCEYRSEPLGLGTERPRFSWQLTSGRMHVLQSAYHLQVAGEEGDFDGDHLIWDTGVVDSDQSVLVEYAGAALQSGQRCCWRVKVWDQQGQESEWSDTSHFEMGLLRTSDWSADWITPEPGRIDPQAEEAFLLRKAIRISKDVRKARIYATSLGFYELELNGERVSDWAFTPGWTSYRHRLQVQAYDVTDLIRSRADNAIGAALANGWYKGNLAWENHRNLYGDQRALLLQLHLEYADGSTEIIGSDPSWKASTGPVRMSEIYHGETYDARLEAGGWSQPGFNDEDWAGIAKLDHAKDILVMQENEPVRVIQELKPVTVLRTPEGDTVLDMGQNMVGRMHMRLNLPAGTAITLKHAEVLDSRGNFYTGNLRKAKQSVTYICRGGGEETYEPHFSFQGFRYVKVEGWPGAEPLNPDRFTGRVMHTDMPQTGRFECSHELLNQLQHNIEWGQRGNFLDIPTDCPQRDERLGWTGDAQVFVRTAAFNFGVAPFFSKWLHDLKADQREDGGVPHVIPQVLDDNAYSSAAWGDAAVICPWTIYLCYGDKRILEEQYDSMKAWVDHIRAQGDNEYLWNTGFHFGDWLALDAKEGSYVGATPRDLIATCFYAYSTSLFVKTAEVLGRTEDAAAYRQLYEKVAEAFLNEFVTPGGRLAAHTQTAMILPLMFGLVEGEVQRRMAATLAEYVKEQNHHLTTGFVGTPYLCHVLTENGYHDLAVKLAMQEDYPSWLYSVKQGATTIWEHWDGIKPDGSFWSDDMNSYNHYAFGAIGDWLYRAVAGLDLNEAEGPGYKRIRLRPRTDSALSYAKAALDSMYGTIRSEWSLADVDGDGDSPLASYEFEIPPNTSVEAELPGASIATTRVNGQPADQASGVLSAREDDAGTLKLELGSGVYRVTVQQPSPALSGA